MQTNYLYHHKQITIPEAATPQHQQGKPLTLTDIFPDKSHVHTPEAATLPISRRASHTLKQLYKLINPSTTNNVAIE